MGMLVLTRRQGEIIHIGDEITVTIVKSGTLVRVGIDAPAGVKILRGGLAFDEDAALAKILDKRRQRELVERK